jgi:chondroitin AC lyase
MGFIKTVPESTPQSSNHIHWVYHDSVAYMFEEGQDLHLLQENRTASWSVINRFMPNPPTESGNVFTMWLQHASGKKENSYCYAILPSVGREETMKYGASKPWKVLANTSTLQAVEHMQDICLQVVFWQPGTLESSLFGKVSVDKPCLLMVRKTGNSNTLSASNPDGKAILLTVKIGAKENQLPLPERGVTATAIPYIH